MVIALLLLALLPPLPDPDGVATVADTLCAESSHNWRDAEAVAAVIVNRADAPGFRSTLSGVVTQPGQFANGCPRAGMHLRHYLISIRAHLCASWSRAVGIWPKRYAEAGRTLRRRGSGTMHIYWRRRPRKG